jgi:RNA polymerase-binding transcription factor DksA
LGASGAYVLSEQGLELWRKRALAEIEDALVRLTKGSYGYCEQCGAGIPAD